jgi:hypothetical protein
VSTPLRFADYVAGHDPALEAALDYRPPQRLSDMLLATADSAAVLNALTAFTDDPLNRYSNQERQMLLAAEQLSRGDRMDDALAVAEFTAARFRASVDAQLRYALVAERAGQVQLAAEAARRALEIAPNSRQCRSLLERLETGMKQ